MALLNRLPALIGYWDRDLANVFANDAYLEYFGVTPAEARGRHISEVLGEAVYQLNLPYIEGALAGREQLFERTLIDRHGVTRHTQASYLPDIVDGEVRGFCVQVTDVTARVEAEHARDDAWRLFQIGMANAPFGKVVTTASAATLHINPSLCTLLGYRAEELMGRNFLDVIHPDDRPEADWELKRLQAREVEQFASERRYVRRDGKTIWMQRTAVLVPGEHGGDDVIVAQFQDVTARRRAEAELARLALTDSLTGLHNRHALSEHADRYRRIADVSVGVIFVDLDGFKAVNDNYGHFAGDGVLVHAARLLLEVVEAPNTAYRLGGDEFIVLVPDAPDSDLVASLAAALGNALTADYPTTPTTRLTASVGWTWGPAEDVEVLLRQADTEMYRHKHRLRKRAPVGGAAEPTG